MALIAVVRSVAQIAARNVVVRCAARIVVARCAVARDCCAAGFRSPAGRAAAYKLLPALTVARDHDPEFPRFQAAALPTDPDD